MFASYRDSSMGPNPTEPLAVVILREKKYFADDGDEVVLGQVLGEGSYGKVYEATVDEYEQRYVVKTCRMTNDEERDVSMNEALKLKDLLWNPFTPSYLHHKVVGDTLFLAMSLVGQSLSDMHAYNKNKPIDIVGVSRISMQMMEAVAYLHSKNIIHIDLSCRNVCFTPNKERVVVIDFGSSLYQNELHTNPRRIVTMPYLSPEGLLRRPIDFQTDVWSCAVIINRLFTGRKPFPCRYAKDLFVKFHQYGLLPDDANTSPDYDVMIAGLKTEFDWDEPRHDDFEDYSLTMRDKSKLLTRDEVEFCTIAMQLFVPDPKSRPSAAECFAKFKEYFDQPVSD